MNHGLFTPTMDRLSRIWAGHELIKRLVCTLFGKEYCFSPVLLGNQSDMSNETSFGGGSEIDGGGGGKCMELEFKTMRVYLFLYQRYKGIHLQKACVQDCEKRDLYLNRDRSKYQKLFCVDIFVLRLPESIKEGLKYLSVCLYSITDLQSKRMNRFIS